MTKTISTEQWYAHPSFRQELEALINNPTFLIAMEIVKDTGNRPITPAMMPSGVTLTEWGAYMGFKRDGYFEALTNLRSLAQNPPTRQQGPKPWETQKPPAQTSAE